MSKFLKIIVNLVVLVAIAVAAALLVPPFVGVDTVMNDNTELETNLPVGSVAYGKTAKAKDLEKGDKIIYSEGSSNYIYKITDMDASAGVYRVKDVYNKSGNEETVTIQKSIPKVVVVVPVIGYAAIALQSKEGLIVVGLGIVFLIILFILSELCRKDDDDDEEDEEEEEEGDEDEETSDDEDDEEEELSWRERRRIKKEEKRQRKLEKKRRAEEDEDEEAEEEDEVSQDASQEEKEPDAFDAAMQDAMSSIAVGVAQVNGSEEAGQSEEAVQAEEEKETAKEQESEQKSEEEAGTETAGEEPQPESEPEAVKEEPEAEEKEQEAVQPEEEIIEIPEPPVNPNAIPQTPTVQELLEKARAAGEEPEVKEDKENELTLLDYSNLL